MKHVLIVDDEKSIQSALSKAIKLLGYDSSVADNGEEAVRLAYEEPFDLIILDIKMDDMSGLEALEKIRAKGKSSKSPVIMLTAYSHPEFVEEAVKHGANDYILKPFNLSLILDRVSVWINANVERSWKELEPEQENLLHMTVKTLNDVFNIVRKGGELPYAQIREAADHIITVMDNGQIAGVLDAVRDHDDYTFSHSLRVGIYMSLFGQSLASFSHDDLVIIATGGVIHDVGKAKTPLTILNKPSELSEEEMKVMMKHVDHTYDILSNTPGVPQLVTDIGWRHHERMDGSGYPQGLKGDEMDVFSKMAAIVDVYVALTDKRVYKPSYTPDMTFEMLKNTPGGLDNGLLQDFRQALYDNGIDT